MFETKKYLVSYSVHSKAVWAPELTEFSGYVCMGEEEEQTKHHRLHRSNVKDT